MSTIMVSGTAQFAVLEIWSRPIAVGSAVSVVFLLSIRFVMLGAALPSWFGTIPPVKRLGTAFFLSDESWAIALQDARRGLRDPAVLVGSGLVLYTGWITGTAIGVVYAPEMIRSIPGLQFMLPALLLAVLCTFWRGCGSSLIPWVVAACAATTAMYLLPGTWYVLIGGFLGAIAGAWHDRN